MYLMHCIVKHFELPLCVKYSCLVFPGLNPSIHSLLLHIFASFFSVLSDAAGSFQSHTNKISLFSPLSLSLSSHLEDSFQRFFFLFFLSLRLQCVRLAARSSWSHGWGRTGSSSFCWACSWLWSAGSWTTPSPSAKKVGKRHREPEGEERVTRTDGQWIKDGSHSGSKVVKALIHEELYYEQLRGIVRYGVKVDGKILKFTGIHRVTLILNSS